MAKQVLQLVEDGAPVIALALTLGAAGEALLVARTVVDREPPLTATCTVDS